MHLKDREVIEMIRKIAKWINEGKIQPPSYLYRDYECNKRLMGLIVVMITALAMCVDFLGAL